MRPEHEALGGFERNLSRKCPQYCEGGQEYQRGIIQKSSFQILTNQDSRMSLFTAAHSTFTSYTEMLYLAA